jgi:hypothetical protein
MKQSTPDFTAGRIQPSQYDTVLPPDARAEFFIPKRSVILGRTSSQREYQFGIFKWVGGFALCAIILAGVIAHHSQSLKTPATPQHAAPVVQPTTRAPKALTRAFGEASAGQPAANATTASCVSASCSACSVAVHAWNLLNLPPRISTKRT